MIRASLALLACCFLAGPAFADPPAGGSQSFEIKGGVNHPRTLTLADLQKEPRTEQTVFLHTGHGAVSGKFAGVSLWTLLEEAGIVTDMKNKNDIVRHFIVVTGSDGYAAVLSVGEIAPEFGGDQAMIAYEEFGKPLEAGDGFARLIIPGDKAAGRAVSAVTSIEVK
jgi:DMSO/TMAO reductase YedYZ molybdopterin-dependent catalytic subunit